MLSGMLSSCEPCTSSWTSGTVLPLAEAATVSGDRLPGAASVLEALAVVAARSNPQSEDQPARVRGLVERSDRRPAGPRVGRDELVVRPAGRTSVGGEFVAVVGDTVRQDRQTLERVEAQCV